MTNSPISRWLRLAFDSTTILSKVGWASVLGVSLDTLSRFLAGDTVPEARTLRSMFLILQDHESDAARQACELWHELASRPLREVHPTARSEAPTLAHYVLGPLWEDHRLAVLALPAHEQEQLLQNGIYEATRWAIARNRAAAGLPLILSDDDRQPHAAAPPENEAAAETSAGQAAPMASAKDEPLDVPIAAHSSAPSPYAERAVDDHTAQGRETQRIARGSSPALDPLKEPQVGGPFFPSPSSRKAAILRTRPPLHHRLPNPQEQPHEGSPLPNKKRDE